MIIVRPSFNDSTTPVRAPDFLSPPFTFARMRHLLRYLLQRLYTTWAVLWFIVPFLLIYPWQQLFSRRPQWHKYVHVLNRGWSKFSIMMWGMPVRVRREVPGPLPTPCVYVANHSSYVDIMLLFKVIPGFLNMMGKASLARVPVWGPLFGRVYITVDRNSAVSRGRAIVAARRALAAGQSICIFPEGRVSTTPGEVLLPFQDGAFQLAIDAKVPIVPIGMATNHRFMPDVPGSLRVRYAPLHLTLHAPIDTKNLTATDVPALKQRVAEIIAADFLPTGRGIPEASTWKVPHQKPVETARPTAQPSRA